MRAQYVVAVKADVKPKIFIRIWNSTKNHFTFPSKKLLTYRRGYARIFLCGTVSCFLVSVLKPNEKFGLKSSIRKTQYLGW
jgi:hypothetical protein